MANLAIRGHNRGKEVIKTLEMLGGINKFDLEGNTDHWYVLEDSRVIRYCETLFEEKGFTLEEFFKKFPYKVGDKALAFDNKCTIIDAVWDECIKEVVYTIKLDASKYTTTKLSHQLQPYLPKEETIEPIIEMSGAQCVVPIPKGYEFTKIDDDNHQVVFTKIQSQYPTTYKECCEVLGCKADYFFTDFSCNNCDVEISDYENKIDDLLQNFRRLRYCRDAYWKIAGEQMGLDEPWSPDYIEESHEQGCPIKYVIYYTGTHITKGQKCTPSYILAFPTAEMRDAFYENFKDLIIECMELL